MFNEQSFNKTLGKIAPDLKLMFDYPRHRWGVYLVRTRHIVLAGPAKPWLLFDIEDAKKEFRLPDHTDLSRAAASVYSGHKMWDKGSEWYMDKVEAQEQARIDAARTRTDTKVKEAAREVKFHTTVTTNHNLRGARG